MNFKRFYINGHKYSVTILYRTKIYRLHFENFWNTLMYKLTDYTTAKYLVKEEKPYFVVYLKKSFTFELTFIEKWIDKEKAKDRMKELNKTLN